MAVGSADFGQGFRESRSRLLAEFSFSSVVTPNGLLGLWGLYLE